MLARCKPTQFQQAIEICGASNGSLHLAVRQVVGADHATVGAMLVEKWRFAPQLVETVSNQYGPNPKDTGMIACVYAANQISKRMNFGSAGNPYIADLPDSVARRLGGSLEEVILSLGDLAPMFEETKVFSTV